MLKTGVKFLGLSSDSLGSHSFRTEVATLTAKLGKGAGEGQRIGCWQLGALGLPFKICKGTIQSAIE